MPVPDDGGAVCYQNGDVVKENYQMCDVTNKQIIEILKGKKPQVTFTCNRDDATCAFQCEAPLFYGRYDKLMSPSLG